MNFKCEFNKGFKEFIVKDRNVIMELRQNHIDGTLSEVEEIEKSLENPINSKRLSEIVRRGERVVIITSDVTRPMPSMVVLPEILKELYAGDIKDEDIKIVFALGSHRKQTETEMRYIVGDDIFKRIKCIDSDPDDCMRLGYTSHGTPIDIFSEVAKADRRICLGNIEFHYFAGYSGGSKAIMPGVSSREAIQNNHSAMVNEDSKAGFLIGNPVRSDIEEVEKYVTIDFILNVVLDENKKIIKSFAGHHIVAHREGCNFLDALYKVKIPRKADIVITSPGGYPKDINLYQAQKALDNAKHAVKDGGIIIFVASCNEGLGEENFKKWIMASTNTKQMIQDIEDNFELGGHKAAAIAMVREKAKIFSVTDLNDEIAERIFMKPFKSVNDALSQAFTELGSNAEVILMPYGGSTLPITD
ncbi:MAG: nickel-dependent lactate racemase [Clostridia bacterium]|jgi:nickel-dependent lactate racemase